VPAGGGPAPGAALPAPPDWKPAILVCDDSPDIRQLLSVVLERAGAEPLLAPTGEDAVALAGRRRPDAVLLDLDLPGISGFDVAEQLRKQGFDGPVIAVTGGGDDLTAAALREQGFTDMIQKPTPGSAVVDALAGQLPDWTPRRHRTGQAR
jgi:DNA-binding response OmpR family regulator